MNPHRPCANVGSLWILSAPLRMSKAFLRYSFSIVRAASMQRRRCRNARCDARALFTTFAPRPCTIGFRHLCQQLPPAPRARPARPRRRPRPPPPPKAVHGGARWRTPERGHGDVSLLLLDAGVADHPGPALRLFLLELRHVRRAAATGQKMQLPVSFLDLRLVERRVNGPVEL